MINIELKREADTDSIKKQLLENKYYLSFLAREVYNITYVAKNKKLYRLIDDDLHEITIKDLMVIINNMPEEIQNIDILFDPSNYLVSPFNATERFMSNEYFLTSEQKSVNKSICKHITGDSYELLSIKGNAGTGKTLLAYDIAKEAISMDKKVLIIQCSQLNQGHHLLNKDYGWNIKSFSEIKVTTATKKMLIDYDIIIIDEAQRISKPQLLLIAKNYKNNYHCIFAHDPVQTLGNEYGGSSSMLLKNIAKANQFSLREKVRTNKEISIFIKQFIDNKNNKYPKQGFDNVSVVFFNDIHGAHNHIKKLSTLGWKHIKYTPKRYGQSAPYQKINIADTAIETVHKIIGQEFDNLVVIVDERFFYKEDGKLTYNIIGTTKLPYYPHSMLFQMLTRARKKLKIIIVDNPVILERCVQILSSEK